MIVITTNTLKKRCFLLGKVFRIQRYDVIEHALHSISNSGVNDINGFLEDIHVLYVSKKA